MSGFYRRHGGRGPGFAKFEGFEGPPGAEADFEGPAGFAPGPDPAHLHGHGHAHGPGPWNAGTPPWRGGRRARRGDIRWALLIALLDGPSHGYELIGRLEARTGGMWRPSAGSVYPTLQLLEDEGLIRGLDAEGKRVFELTDEGRAAATQAAERVGRGPWGSAATGHHSELRQAMKTLMLAMRQVVAAGDDDQVRAATRVLTDARQRLYRILAGESPTGQAESPEAG